MFHPDDVEQDLYDKVYDQIKDEIREDLLNELNYNKNNKLIDNIKDDITSEDNSSILNENIKQDTQDENIVDKVLETEINNNNEFKENINGETIIVDDIMDEAFETNINEDVVEDILITTPVISNNTNNNKNKSTPIENIYDFFEKDEKHKVIILNNNDTNTKDKISKRTYEFLNFYKELYDISELESNENFNSLDDCSEYILKLKGKRLSKASKSNWKRIIIRSNEIFNEFGKKLFNVYYNINNIRYIKNENWIKWKDYLKIKIEKSTPIGVIENNLDKTIEVNNAGPSTALIDNKFNYNYILENKKGCLFEEDNKLYTYNFYEEKVVADVPNGDSCMKCSYTKFTTSGCCIYRNCENRKYGDYELVLYKEINGKECESKYNKKLNKK